METTEMTIDMQLFRQRLRYRLKQLNMKQYQLAEKAGVSKSIIEKWLHGKNDDYSGIKKDYIPSLETVYKVSKVLGVSIDWLVNSDYDIDCVTVTNQQIHDLIGLNDNGIAGLQTIKQADDKQIEDEQDGGQQALCLLPVLNDILSVSKGLAFKDILQAFRDFLKSDYVVPLHSDDNGDMVASSKKYKGINPKILKGKRAKVGSVSYASDFYLQYFGREDNIHQSIPVAINKDFMQAVAFEQLKTTLINIQQDIPN